MEKHISGISNLSYLSNGEKDILVFGHKHNPGIDDDIKENYKYNCNDVTVHGHLYLEDLFREIYDKSNILGNKISYFIEGSKTDWDSALINRRRSNFIDSNLFFYRKYKENSLNDNKLILCDNRKSTMGDIYKPMKELLYGLWNKQNINNEEIEQLKVGIIKFLVKGNDDDIIHRYIFDNEPEVKNSGIGYIKGVKRNVNNYLNTYIDYVCNDVNIQDNNRKKYKKLRIFITTVLSEIVNYRIVYYINNKDFSNRLILNYGSEHHSPIVVILKKIGWKLEQNISAPIENRYCISVKLGTNMKLFRDNIQFGGSKKWNKKIRNNNITKSKVMKGGYIDISDTFRPLGNIEEEKKLARKLMDSSDEYDNFEGVRLYVNIQHHIKKENKNIIGGTNEKILNCTYCNKKYIYAKNLIKHIDKKHK